MHDVSQRQAAPAKLKGNIVYETEMLKVRMSISNLGSLLRHGGKKAKLI
jgi:hypothetical protein